MVILIIRPHMTDIVPTKRLRTMVSDCDLAVGAGAGGGENTGAAKKKPKASAAPGTVPAGDTPSLTEESIVAYIQSHKVTMKDFLSALKVYPMRV